MTICKNCEYIFWPINININSHPRCKAHPELPVIDPVFGECVPLYLPCREINKGECKSFKEKKNGSS